MNVHRVCLPVVALLAALTLLAATAPAEAEPAPHPPVVPSPYTVTDVTGEARYGDITGLQIRTAPAYLELRFRMFHFPAHAQPPAEVRFSLDLRGVREDLWVRVGPAHHGLSVWNDEGVFGTEVCRSRNVVDLGTNERGHGFSARVRYSCLDHARAFAVQMFTDHDSAPNDGPTPFVGSAV